MRLQCRKSIVGSIAGLVPAVCLLPSSALAQTSSPIGFLVSDGALQQTVLMVALTGAMIFAVISTISLMRARDRSEQENRRLKEQLLDLQGTVDRAEALVSEHGQRLVAWGGSGNPPLIAGSLPPEAGAPADDAAFMSFGTWLAPASADRLPELIVGLRTQGRPFTETLESGSGRQIEVRGWITGGTSALRFRDLSGDRLALSDLRQRHDALGARLETMRAMLSAAPLLVWQRDGAGRLTWVNRAYVSAVEASDFDDVIANQLELFDSVGRQAVAKAHAHDAIYTGRLPAIVDGERRSFDVSNIVSGDGSAGIAADATEAEAARTALHREIDFNARTLDQLQTAVAIFSPDRRLRSYNAAYRSLFGLDDAFLESSPDEGAVLERLRTSRKIPEQVDFRKWREWLLAAYRSPEAQEYQWHLPDGQTLRVVANPHPLGGVTWIYENVTERLDLESRYNTLKSVQGETLDHLDEGVAVFGSNGRLRLFNPAFADIWSLEQGELETLPHVSDVVEACRKLAGSSEVWQVFTASIAGLDEQRSSQSGRINRNDGGVIDYATVPLPDGQTMVTFVDVTDSANVEKALVEKNEALEAASRLKNAFIRHVSYELRSPLTNIIGFAQLLTDERIGTLNDKQGEYVGYVLSSSGSLLAIINDILDLTTADAGVTELDISEVSIADVINETAADLSDRIADKNIELIVDIPPGAGRFVADEKRIRQILFNLLSNAIDYSDPGGRVQIAAARQEDSIRFEVRDEGAGFPSEFVAKAFDRFTSLPRGGTRGGAGLGLAIVKSFVDLHGGGVEIDSVEGKGATVHVSLPLRPRFAATAAE